MRLFESGPGEAVARVHSRRSSLEMTVLQAGSTIRASLLLSSCLSGAAEPHAMRCGPVWSLTGATLPKEDFWR